MSTLIYHYSITLIVRKMFVSVLIPFYLLFYIQFEKHIVYPPLLSSDSDVMETIQTRVGTKRKIDSRISTLFLKVYSMCTVSRVLERGLLNHYRTSGLQSINVCWP